jgi:hypothetical protein
MKLLETQGYQQKLIQLLKLPSSQNEFARTNFTETILQNEIARNEFARTNFTETILQNEIFHYFPANIYKIVV